MTLRARKTTPTQDQQWAADANNDDEITPTDARQVFGAFMGQGTLSGKKAYRMLQATSVSVGSMPASPGEEVTVPIYLTPSSPVKALAITLAFDNTSMTKNRREKRLQIRGTTPEGLPHQVTRISDY